MMRLRIGLVLFASVLIAAGCVPAALPTPARAPAAAPVLATQVAAAGPAAATPAPADTATAAAPTTTVTATAEPPAAALPTAPLAPASPVPSPAAPVPTAAPAGPGSGRGASGPYFDDRSSAAGLITSYFNAINHNEYARAYGYWNQQAGQANGLPPFAQFRAGYTATKSVDLTIGTIRGDVGAGQLYYWVPVALVGHNADGTAQAFAGCYKMHLGRPAIQAVPPFQPLAIESATVQQAADRAAAQAALAGVCGDGGQPLAAVPAPNPADLSAAQYIDDRSDAAGVLRSLINALNSKEYVRAYSYWEPGSSQRLPFDQFEQGYANTAAVEFVMGSTRPGAAAGNIYYQAPVVLTAQNTDGSRQTFAGCYTLHMANPGMQTEPPFRPLGIQSAKVRPVPNDSDRQALLQSACSQ